MPLPNSAWATYCALLHQYGRSGSSTTQIILPNVLEEQTVIAGPQYTENHPSQPWLCLHTCPWRILPDWEEEKVTICAVRSKDWGWSLIGWLASKTVNPRFLGYRFLQKGNHITKSTDGGVLISQSAQSYCSSLSICVWALFERWPFVTNFWTQVQESTKKYICIRIKKKPCKRMKD